MLQWLDELPSYFRPNSLFHPRRASKHPRSRPGSPSVFWSKWFPLSAHIESLTGWAKLQQSVIHRLSRTALPCVYEILLSCCSDVPQERNLIAAATVPLTCTSHVYLSWYPVYLLPRFIFSLLPVRCMSFWQSVIFWCVCVV